MNILQHLYERNAALTIFGTVNFAAFVLFVVFSQIDHRVLMGVNVWIKPMKFAVSIGIFCWTIAWFLGYLPESSLKNGVVWTIIITMIIEMLCIGIQAGRGVLSHFNVQTPLDGAVFGLMGIAIGINTAAVGIVAWLFFQNSPVHLSEPLPTAYLWAIRLGLLIFIVASLQGYLMGGRLQHSVGAPDGTAGLPFLNWSRSVGDLRIAHFVGLHAIQILPLFGFVAVRFLSPRYALAAVFFFSVFYGILCIIALLQALAGVPLVKS